MSRVKQAVRCGARFLTRSHTLNRAALSRKGWARPWGPQAAVSAERVHLLPARLLMKRALTGPRRRSLPWRCLDTALRADAHRLGLRGAGWARAAGGALPSQEAGEPATAPNRGGAGGKQDSFTHRPQPGGCPPIRAYCTAAAGAGRALLCSVGQSPCPGEGPWGGGGMEVLVLG